jgi:hypothetical protein
MTTEKENKESMYTKMDRDNAIRSFGDALTGDEGKKGDVFFASCSRFFTWDGGRLWFKNENGETIKASDPSVAAFFADKYDFLMPTPKAEDREFNGDSVTIDPAIIESALGINGKPNLTAIGQVARAFGADGTNSPASIAAAAKAELFLKAEAKHGSGAQRDDKGQFVPNPHGDGETNNPFLRAGWNMTEQSRIYKKDPALAARLAARAGVALGSAHAVK